MIVSLRWLSDYVNTTLPVKELAQRLTAAGMEVKNIQISGGTWENIVIGQIVNVDPHPNADRLKLVTVDLSSQRPTVVCGAPNLSIGDKVAFAHCGAQLIDAHTGQLVRLKPAKIRGISSEGMICSEKELGISDSHEGIVVLSPDAPIGVPLADYLGDVILDLDITPNRPDCLSITGIAREIAALTEQPFHLPEIKYEELGSGIHSLVTVEIADPALCSRYCASLVTNVKIGASPQWMQQQLLACGMRPINNIVDITNYVMLEYGQPLHAFDYREIKGKRIIVRRAHNGETMISLDGVERALSEDMLVIADGERPVAIAGIMGGLETEVTPNTTSILLESANFNQAIIRKGCNALYMRTEASLRFEKGLSPELPLPALMRATQLMLEIAGGTAAKGIVDVYPGRAAKESIPLYTSEVKRLLGMELDIDQAVKILDSLGFGCEVSSVPGEIKVSVPYWRSDIQLSADLAEEVARVVSYDEIPTTLLASPLPSQEPEPQLAFRDRVKDIMVACGFQEVLTYSLTSLGMLEKIAAEPRHIGPSPLRVANPMTAEQEYLRTTLRASLLTTLFSNQKHEEGGIRLFEVSKVYLPRKENLPQEQEMLCAVLSGPRSDLSWHKEDGELDFLDAKGVVEALLSQLGVEARFNEFADASLRPGRRAEIVVAGEAVGVIGELHPQVVEAFELSGVVFLFEIDLGRLLPLTARRRQYQPLPRFPSTVRDIALVVDTPLPYQKVADIIASFPLVSKVTLFDLYTGEQVPAGKKSIAFRVVYQSPTRTLTEEGVNEAQQQILDKLYQEVGATLRG